MSQYVTMCDKTFETPNFWVVSNWLHSEAITYPPFLKLTYW